MGDRSRGRDNGGRNTRAIAMARLTGRERAAAARAGSLRAKPLGIVTKPLRAAGRVLPVAIAGLDYVEGRSQGEDRVRAAVGAGGAAAGAWYGAAQGGMGGAALGTLTGPAAPVASPVLGFVGAVGGGLIGSGVGGWVADRVDGLIRGDRGTRKQVPVSRAIAASAPSTIAAPQQLASPYLPTSPKVENINAGWMDNSPAAIGGTAVLYGGAALGAGKLAQSAYNFALNPRTEAPLAAARSSKQATAAITGLGGLFDAVASKGAKGPLTTPAPGVPSPGYSPRYGGIDIRPQTFGNSPIGGVAPRVAPRALASRVAPVSTMGYSPQPMGVAGGAPAAFRVSGGGGAAIAPMSGIQGGVVSEADSFKRIGNRWVRVAKVPAATRAVNIIDSARGALQGLRSSGLPQSVSQLGRGGKAGLAVAGVTALGVGAWGLSKVFPGQAGTPWGQGPSLLDPFGLNANPGGRQAITDAQQAGQNARTGATNLTRLQTSKQQAEATLGAAALRLQGQREKLIYQATGQLPGSVMGSGGREYAGPAFGQGGARVSPGAGNLKPPQVAAAEATAKGASDRQRVQTGGQIEVARISRDATLSARQMQEMGATTRQRIATGGQIKVADITSSRNLQGRVYEANAGITRQQIATGGQIKVADITSSRNLQGRVYEANAGITRQQIATGGQIKVADITSSRNLQGRVYEADTKLRQTDIETGRKLQGQTYEADTKRAIAGIETGGKVQVAELDSTARIKSAQSAMAGQIGAAAAGAKLPAPPKTWEEAAIRQAGPTTIAYEANRQSQQKERDRTEAKLAANWQSGQSRIDSFNAAGRQQQQQLNVVRAKGEADAKSRSAAEEEKTRREWLLRSLGL